MVKKNRDSKDVEKLDSGTRKTNFLISIYRTEHQSLQGNIQWLDSGVQIHFRSELEMLHLIQEAMKETKQSEELRSWDDATLTLRNVK